MTQKSLFPLTGAFPGPTGAVFSPCRKYRYVLWRRWTRDPLIAFIGLNPSTADEVENDRTIRRCIGFTKREGYGGLVMLNLFAYRHKSPDRLFAAADPVGPENDDLLVAYAGLSDKTVAAWGADPRARSQAKIVRNSLVMAGVPLHCLGTTADGSPRHPLYLRSDTPLELLV